MGYFRSMDAMGIYMITTGIMILLYFTTTKNHVLLMSYFLIFGTLKQLDLLHISPSFWYFEGGRFALLIILHQSTTY